MSAPTTPRVCTRTGIVIGGAHVAPPPPASADAEAIQAALLGSRHKPSPARRLTEREIDAAIRSNRDDYDRAECFDDWPDEAAYLDADLAAINAAGQAPLRGAAKVVAGVILAAVAACALLIAWGMQS